MTKDNSLQERLLATKARITINTQIWPVTGHDTQRHAPLSSYQRSAELAYQTTVSRHPFGTSTVFVWAWGRASHITPASPPVQAHLT
jgi:hypothetical protein